LRRFKSFEKELSLLNENNFDNIALSLFRLQADTNDVYKNYLTSLGVNPAQINQISEIPFLPISFFKDLEVKSGDWKEEQTFLSSTTTGGRPSKHKVFSKGAYLANTELIFNRYYGSPQGFHFFALLPAYLERDGSSLVEMVSHLIAKSDSSLSSFYLHNTKDLKQNIQLARNSTKQIMLIGVTFALLDLAEEGEFDLSDCIIMETGGMKGRREEITREELHHFLCTRFNSKTIHSEYGMTELFSQAYSKGKGYFSAPPGMKIIIRDINDPFDTLEKGKTGGINVIDLANIYTCAFVETQDLGRIRQDGSFEVLGRMDNSDIRGCNLLVG
jgi:phenylacetate-coenzyme A ligase PaaK-like adenylate-forming protein